MEKRKIFIDEFAKYKILQDIQWSHSQILLTVMETNLKKNACVSHLWMVSEDSGKSRQFTYDECVDANPRFSPSGETVAFLSNRTGKQQIHLISTMGGESRPLTDLDGNFEEPVWSPDGQQIAFAFQASDIAQKQNSPRYIRRFQFKQDGLKFAPEDFWHIWLVEVETGICRKLTSGEFDHHSPTWSHDSTSIVCVANRNEDGYLEPSNTDLWRISLPDLKLKRLTTEYGPVEAPSWSPDGRFIAYLGHRGKPGEEQIKNYHLWIYDVKTGETKDISPTLGFPCLNLLTSDTVGYGKTNYLSWEPDSSGVYSLVSEMGRCHLYKMSIDSRPYPITCGDMCVYSYALANRCIYFLASSFLNPCEAYSVSIPTTYSAPNKETQIGSFNQIRMEEIGLKAPEFFQCEGEHRTVYGFLYHPPDFDPTQRYPFLLIIHGGPYLFYGCSFFHQMHYLASQGYVVLCPNQGGSQSYGEKHTALIHHNWGKNDYPDLMKAVDHIVAKGYIDENRMGVCGASYGGFMTNWIISHTVRFKAAVTQRCISDFIGMVGTSDASVYLYKEIGGMPWEKWEEYREWSPIFMADKIETPLLILCGELDQRTPMSQSEELYVALKYQKKLAEMLYFPGESHSIMRNGTPKNRILLLEAIKEWFDKYLRL